MNYLLITVLLILAMPVYFGIARRYNIVDVPNHRSSHAGITIRGAGILFPLAVVLCSVLFGGVNVLLLAALLLISCISFADDLKPLPAMVRLPVHLLSVCIMLFALDIYTLWPLWLVLLAYGFIIGSINAFNFMDGINGITGIYALVALATLWYINVQVKFVQPWLVICPLIACGVFLFFNYRKKALCFAGDVGSISMAFWLLALLLMLIYATGNFKYVFLLSVYGADVFFTVIKRLKLKQNILQAHRLHVYQLLANNGGYSHRVVAAGYGLVQLLVNLFVLNTGFHFAFYLFLIAAATAFAYILLERKYRYPIAVA